MNLELIRSVTTWAAMLSGYPMPEALPTVVVVNHTYIVKHACQGRECNVAAWYNDAGIVYWDAAFSMTERDDILLHEIVHYMQDLSLPGKQSCADFIAREKEAYRVQAEYLVRTGRLAFVAYAPRPMICPGG